MTRSRSGAVHAPELHQSIVFPPFHRLAYGWSVEFESMSVVDDAIQNCVSDRGITDRVVPGLHWYLTGDDGRGESVTILEDLEQVSPFGVTEYSETQVVQDQNARLCDLPQELGIGAVCSGHVELVVESRHAFVERGVALATRLIGQSTRDPRLSDSGRAGQDDGLMMSDPSAGGESFDDGSIQLPLMPVIDVLDAGSFTEFRH